MDQKRAKARQHVLFRGLNSGLTNKTSWKCVAAMNEVGQKDRTVAIKKWSNDYFLFNFRSYFICRKTISFKSNSKSFTSKHKELKTADEQKTSRHTYVVHRYGVKACICKNAWSQRKVFSRVLKEHSHSQVSRRKVPFLGCINVACHHTRF